jgi:hypothetical protein
MLNWYCKDGLCKVSKSFNTKYCHVKLIFSQAPQKYSYHSTEINMAFWSTASLLKGSNFLSRLSNKKNQYKL